MAEYRIEYSIQRAIDDGNDFEEVGFGSSGTWRSVEQCAHMVESDIQNGTWETKAGMPDPQEISG